MKKQRTEIASMFDAIAHRYDRANRVLSGGFDLLWRRWILQRCKPGPSETWLDIASGTGDMIVAAKKLQPGTTWYALDPSIRMLQEQKARRNHLSQGILQGASENLPFSGDTFHGVTIAFGLRNFEDPEAGLSEILRILHPEGTLAILEFHPGKQNWGSDLPAKLYLRYVLPKLGGLISGNSSAYSYLNRSSSQFWTAEALKQVLRRMGYKKVRQWTLMFDAVTMTLAEK